MPSANAGRFMADIYQLARLRLTTYYQNQGYMLARAFLPAQDIEDGVVRIERNARTYDYTPQQPGLAQQQDPLRAADHVGTGCLSLLLLGCAWAAVFFAVSSVSLLMDLGSIP